MPASSIEVLPGKPFRTLLRFNRPYAWHYALGAGLAVVYTVVEMGMPAVIRQTVALFEAGAMTYTRLFLLFLALLGISAGAGAARYIQRMYMIGASRKFEYDLRNAYFHHIQTLSLDFFQSHRTGDIMARATNDLSYVRSFIGPGLMNSANLFRVPVTIAFMLYLSGRLTLIGLLPTPAMAAAVYGFVMYMHRQSKVVQDQFSVVSSRAQENLAGARIVKAYGIADRESRVFSEESRKYMHESLKLAYATSLIWPLLELMVALTIVVVLWKGGQMVIYDAAVSRPAWTAMGLSWEETAFSLADFSAFIMCLVMLIFPLTEFGWVMTLYQRGAVSMNRIIEIMALKPSIADVPASDATVRVIKGDLRFEGACFAFEDRPILKDVHLHVPRGTSLAVVGPTGSGKSTLVSLLLRERDVTSGAVRLDGHDVRDIPLEVLRGHIGYVPQDTFIFSDTIRANLLYGRPDADDEAIAWACELAQFHDTMEGLPNGLDTMLGERGVNLSGGQKQRLAIARAVIRQPAILILDDALSSVDTHTEEEILKNLRRFMEERTSILISHRVSTVREADHIIVLEDGVIVEQGSHAALLAHGGLYARMHQRQLLEEELERA